MNEQSLINRLQSLSERDLMERVIAPLLESLGFSRVDLVHGPHEMGKDLVCWRQDTFGRTEATAVQVRRFRPSAKVSGQTSFQALIHQLRMGLELPLNSIDGTTHRPSQVVFVTPYPFSSQIVEAYSSQLQDISRHIVFLDGPRLAGLLRQHLPNLVKALVGTETGSPSRMIPTLGIDFGISSSSTLSTSRGKAIIDFLAALQQEIGRLIGPEDISDPLLCFAIMSFSKNPVLADFYEKAIKPTIADLGYRCERLDEQHFNGRITERIVRNLRAARFVVADLTEARPNCYYELGVAHSLRKEVIHLAYSGDPGAIHFDIKDFNFIVYSRIDELAASLRERVLATVGPAGPNDDA
jgi:hypothetical protein